MRRWCVRRVPDHVRNRVRVECEIASRHLTIVECRPPWDERVGAEWTRAPVARFRYTKAQQTWTLYWPDRNARFHLYQQLAPSPHVEVLLHEVEQDPTALFWG